MLRGADLFREDAKARRRLLLLLYALVGPVFLAVLLAVAADGRRLAAVSAVAALIAAGAAWLLLRPEPAPLEWAPSVAVIPTVCCGIAAHASGMRGSAFLGAVVAPLAWSAALFEVPVVWVALATASATCFTVVGVAEGALAGGLNALLCATIAGLVGWVVHEQAQSLRSARRESAIQAERSRALVEAVPDALARVDATGHILDVHGAQGQLPGPSSHLIGRLGYEFLPAEIVPRAREALRRAVETGALTTLEYTAPYPEGPRSFEARIAPAAAGEVVIIRRDVTERARAEEDRRLLAALVRGMADAVIVTDADLRITEYTGRAEELYGWRREEMLGKHLVHDFVSEIPDGREPEIRRLLAEGKQVRTPLRALAKNGAWVDLDVSATPLHDETGRLTAWLSVGRDVRDAVARERALRSSEERLLASETTLRESVAELQEALLQVKRLSGLLPICMHCHKIRDDSGYWARVEAFISERADVKFTHALCPACAKEHYGVEG